MQNYVNEFMLTDKTSVVRLAGSLRHSLVNGVGVRYVLFFQGCPHACPGCQNPETHDPSAGEAKDIRTVVSEILSERYLDGVTFSGGDPFFQPEAAYAIASALREKAPALSLWLYTGWTWEALTTDGKLSAARKVLPYINVLVDGRYIAEERVSADEADAFLYRGSKNQRLIDVRASLNKGRLVLW